jgi:uncharacterized protein YjbI with pentapeptide repeats
MAAWNKWREENRNMRPDLSGARCFSMAKLSEANLAGANLAGRTSAGRFGADLSRANLAEANLTGANLSRLETRLNVAELEGDAANLGAKLEVSTVHPRGV